MPVLIPDDSRSKATYHLYREVEVRIGSRCWIESGTEFHAAAGITIGDDVLISWQCFLIDTDMHALAWEDRAGDYALSVSGEMSAKPWPSIRCLPIIIGHRVWIGARCMIMPGSQIGDGAVIGAGSVVRGYVPPYTLYAGNPARLLKRLPAPEGERA